MYTTAAADRFEIINGPEDGTEFPITRAPFEIGGDPGCTVHARLDEEVNSYHARASAVSKGYSIRSLAGAPVWVNGKRAGRIKSRVARDKDIVRVGRTEFMVVLAEGGLAGRSYGLPIESDFTYFLRSIFRLAAFLLGFAGRLFSHGKIRTVVILAVLIGIACFFSPAFRYWFLSWAYWAWGWTFYWIQWAIYKVRGGA